MIIPNLAPPNSVCKPGFENLGRGKKMLGGSRYQVGVKPAAGTERQKPIGGPHNGICPA